MNLYFLSLLTRDKVERKKNKCSTFDTGTDWCNDYILRSRFNLSLGDIIVGKHYPHEFYWDNGCCITPINFQVNEHNIHPLYWSEIGQTEYEFSSSILTRISKSKVVEDKYHFIFPQVKIGKTRYKLTFNKKNMTCKEILHKLGTLMPGYFTFYGTNTELFGHL
jgi:hypothetical protein